MLTIANTTLLLVLAFGGLLQSSPAAIRHVSAQGSQTTAAQEAKPDTEGKLTTIIQSGSTNTRGYTVVIHNDGSATAVTIGAMHAMVARQEFPPGTIDTKTLRGLLTEIGDVSRVPTGNCVKSDSFGTRTQISYTGKTSGDLQCIRQQSPAQSEQKRFRLSEQSLRAAPGSISLSRSTANGCKIRGEREGPQNASHKSCSYFSIRCPALASLAHAQKLELVVMARRRFTAYEFQGGWGRGGKGHLFPRSAW